MRIRFSAISIERCVLSMLLPRTLAISFLLIEIKNPPPPGLVSEDGCSSAGEGEPAGTPGYFAGFAGASAGLLSFAGLSALGAFGSFGALMTAIRPDSANFGM